MMTLVIAPVDRAHMWQRGCKNIIVLIKKNRRALLKSQCASWEQGTKWFAKEAHLISTLIKRDSHVILNQTSSDDDLHTFNLH